MSKSFELATPSIRWSLIPVLDTPAVTEDPLSPRDRPRFVMVMHDVMITFRLLNPNLAEVFAVAAVDPHFP